MVKNRINGSAGNNGKLKQPKSPRYIDILDIKIPEPAEGLPEWLKTVHNNMHIMLHSARIDPRINNKQLLDFGLQADKICEYLYLAAKHFSVMSKIDIEQFGNIDLIHNLLEQYHKQLSDSEASKNDDTVNGIKDGETEKVEGAEEKVPASSSEEN